MENYTVQNALDPNLTLNKSQNTGEKGNTLLRIGLGAFVILVTLGVGYTMGSINMKKKTMKVKN